MFQLEDLERRLKAKHQLSELYGAAFAGLGCGASDQPAGCRSNHWLVTLRFWQLISGMPSVNACGCWKPPALVCCCDPSGTVASVAMLLTALRAARSRRSGPRLVVQQSSVAAMSDPLLLIGWATPAH